MNIDRVRLFVSAARQLSVTRAACEHKISQSAVSQHLKILQYELGSILYNRNKNGRFVLTDAGQAFYEDAVSVLSSVDELKNKHKKDIYSVTIAASDRPSRFLLPRLMTEFVKTHPLAKLTLITRSSREIEKILLESRVDLALLTDSKLPPGIFVAEPYCVEKLTAFVAADHPLAKGTGLRASEIFTNPVIIKATGDRESKVEAELRKMEKEGVKFKTVIRCESSGVLKEIVKQTMGIGVLYYSAIKPDIDRGEFKIIQFPKFDIAGKGYIVYRKDKPFPMLARDFLLFLRTSVDNSEPIKPVPKGPFANALMHRQVRDYMH